MTSACTVADVTRRMSQVGGRGRIPPSENGAASDASSSTTRGGSQTEGGPAPWDLSSDDLRGILDLNVAGVRLVSSAVLRRHVLPRGQRQDRQHQLEGGEGSGCETTRITVHRSSRWRD